MRFCEQCGKPLEGMTVCGNCGAVARLSPTAGSVNERTGASHALGEPAGELGFETAEVKALSKSEAANASKSKLPLLLGLGATAFIVVVLIAYLLVPSRITEPITGTYVEKGACRTLVFREDGTFRESPSITDTWEGDGSYSIDGTRVWGNYVAVDGGGATWEKGKRLDGDSLIWDGRTFIRQSYTYSGEAPAWLKRRLGIGPNK